MSTTFSNNSTLLENPKPIWPSFFRRSGMWTVAKIVQSGIILLVFYAYAIVLSKDDYGTYQKTFVLIGFLSGLFSLGLPSFISSLPHPGLEATIASIFKKGRWILLSFGGALVISTTVLFPEFSFLEKTLLLLISICSAANLAIEIYALKKAKDNLILFQNLFYTSGYLFIHLFILWIGYQLQLLLFALLLLSLFRFFWISFKIKTPSTLKQHSAFTIQKTILHQWAYLAFHETIEAFSKYIDKITLIGIITAADFAVYYNGSFEIPFVGLLVAAVGTFINLQITQYQLNNAAILLLFRNSTLWCATLLFPFFFYVWIYAPSLFSVVFKDKYNDAVPFFLIYAWIIPLRVGNYTAVLQNKMRNNIIMTGSVTALIIKMLLMLFCYPILGIKGIAIAVVIGTYYQVIFYLYYTKRELNVSFSKVLPFQKLLLLFITSGMTVICFYRLLINEKTIYQVAGGGTLVLVVSLLLFKVFVQGHLKQINQ